MKYLFIIFYTVTTSVNAQLRPIVAEQAKLVCTYRLTFRPDSLSDNISTEKLLLLVGSGFSEFKSAPQSRDSLEASLKARAEANTISKEDLGPAISAMLRAPRRRFNYLIYKLDGGKACVVHDDIIGEHYRYEEPDYPLLWQQTTTTASILGYKCQKATTSFAGRRYEAWFTREIPISDGPYKFSGLPGLIVRIGDITNSYVFELLSVGKPTKPAMLDTPPTELVMTTTKHKFLEARKAVQQNPMGMAAQAGVTFKNPEAVREHIREGLKHANNPLELVY